jgi:hypothetical protein
LEAFEDALYYLSIAYYHYRQMAFVCLVIINTNGEVLGFLGLAWFQASDKNYSGTGNANQSLITPDGNL